MSEEKKNENKNTKDGSVHQQAISLSIIIFLTSVYY
jgi:hypothetical protein